MSSAAAQRKKKDTPFLSFYPSDGKTYKCDICGESAVLFKDDAELHLCNEHLKKLLLRSLTPEEFKKLRALVGNIFLLHEDYYASDGEAVQPIKTVDGK